MLSDIASRCAGQIQEPGEDRGPGLERRRALQRVGEPDAHRHAASPERLLDRSEQARLADARLALDDDETPARAARGGRRERVDLLELPGATQDRAGTEPDPRDPIEQAERGRQLGRALQPK
jgi:hypothetical protein